MTGFHPFKGKVSRHFADNRLAPEDPYLSYHDIRLTKEDVDCIRSDWLTDNAIAFWEEYLEHDKLNNVKGAHIILLRPTMSFLLMNTADPSTLKDVLPSFDRVTHIFLPINDNRNVEMAEGGSHWSLLLVSVLDRVSFHYDSLHSANSGEARTVATKLSQLLGVPLKFVNLEKSPQQENSSDCGVFVCMEMRYLLLNRLLRTDSNEKIDMSLEEQAFDASNGRRHMLKVIENFRKEGERRRSRSISPYGSKNHSKSPPRIGDDG